MEESLSRGAEAETQKFLDHGARDCKQRLVNFVRQVEFVKFRGNGFIEHVVNKTARGFIFIFDMAERITFIIFTFANRHRHLEAEETFADFISLGNFESSAKFRFFLCFKNEKRLAVGVVLWNKCDFCQGSPPPVVEVLCKTLEVVDNIRKSTGK